jgi:hypothetical protein
MRPYHLKLIKSSNFIFGYSLDIFSLRSVSSTVVSFLCFEPYMMLLLIVAVIGLVSLFDRALNMN